jgi:hypothetical protein
MEKIDIIYPVPLSTVRRPVFVVVRKLFTAKQCEQLVSFAETHRRFYRSGGSKDARSVDIFYFSPSDMELPFAKIGRVAVERNVWNFALSGFTYPMRIQKYGRGGFTNEHIDFEYEASDLSKITAVVPLVKKQNWTGGRIEIGNHNQSPSIDMGDCLLFPSFYPHSVTPVTKGMRIILSAWVSGPVYV